jgi:diguanylate cyclase (GGDEF)-like protein/PAS domain S-box-containing protein
MRDSPVDPVALTGGTPVAAAVVRSADAMRMRRRLPLTRTQAWIIGLGVALCAVVLALQVAVSLGAAWPYALLGLDSVSLHSTLQVFGLVAIGGAVTGLVWMLIDTRSALERSQARAATIEDAIASLSMGVALWDDQGRLISCNEAYRVLYPELRPYLVPGAAYDDLVRTYYPLAPAEVIDGRTLEQFVEDSQKRFRSLGVSETLRAQHGRWLLMTDCKTTSGGTISFRMDITEQRLFDLELRKRRKVIDDLAELTYEWYWRQDVAGRFVDISASIEQHLGRSRDDFIGRRRDELPGFECDSEDLATYERAITEHKPFSWVRFRLRRGDGESIWVALTGRPIFDENGVFEGFYGAGRDVTSSEVTLVALRQSEERFRALTMLATEWYWETDAELRFTLVRGPASFADKIEGSMRGQPVAFLSTHPRYQLDWQKIGGYLQRRESFRREPFVVTDEVTGKHAYYETSAEPFYDGERFAGYRGIVWDVTERESMLARITESEARFRALTELSSDWYWEMDEQLRFTGLRRGRPSTGSIEDDDIIGKFRWELPVDLVQPASWDEHRAVLYAHKSFRDLIYRHVTRDGTVTYKLTSGDPVFDKDGAFRGYRGIGKDITDQVRTQERIERLATTDALTQLMNRQTFDERASRILANAYTEGRNCALLFLDLDNFRLLNNGYGHRVGDQVLSIVASRMRAVVSEPNLLARRGGDEMVILLTDIPRPEVAVETAQALIKAISEPARVLGMEVSVTPSVGIGFFPQDGVDLDSLLNAADAAMYQAKESGRRTYSFFTPQVARRVDLRLRLEQRLRKAVEARDFKLYYQPLVSLVDGKMIGAEALLRWKDAELGDISPGEFVPIAEESGLIIGLGDWVLREACRARQVWRQLGLDVPPLAINMSGVQLRQLGCVENTLEVINEFEVAPNEIEIEVTETGLLDTSAVSRENLIRMRNAGVKLALDDFGVGFSSLSHLRDLPIHRLKIDRSFTVECMRDARTLTIVKAVIEMARSLGISVTAEGIETQAQQTWMQHLGCDSAQGYLFARPLPVEDFLKLFIDRRGVGRERSLMH